MKTKTLVVPEQEYMKLFAMRMKLETFFSYRDDMRPAINNMAPSFLEDCEILLKEYKELRKQEIKNKLK